MLFYPKLSILHLENAVSHSATAIVKSRACGGRDPRSLGG